jgi:hypothetical protein
VRLAASIANTSTRTGINAHYCKDNNITDLSNKYIAQNNISYIIGSLIGLCCTFFIPMNFYSIMPFIISVSVVHMISSHISCKKIFLAEMNPQRAYIVIQEYLKSRTILDEITTNKKEKFLFNKLSYLKFCNYPFDKLINKYNNDDYLNDILNCFSREHFFCYVHVKVSKWNLNKIKIYTFMKLDGEQIDIFLAFIFSVKLYESLKNKSNLSENVIICEIKRDLNWLGKINKIDLSKKLKEQGWVINFNLLEEKYERVQILV